MEGRLERSLCGWKENQMLIMIPESLKGRSALYTSVVAMLCVRHVCYQTQPFHRLYALLSASHWRTWLLEEIGGAERNEAVAQPFISREYC